MDCANMRECQKNSKLLHVVRWLPASSMTQSTPEAQASQMSVLNTFSPVYQQLQQQQPCCSFSGAHLQNCTGQTPPTTSQNKQQ